MEKFLEIYGTLPRAGPGSNALTRQAFALLEGLPDAPKILDVGCGPGMQTIELLTICSGNVVALDLLPQMLDRLAGEAKTAGVSERLEIVEQDMNAMEFPPQSFDVVWSEGAVYLLGFEAGLRKFQPLVKPGGYVSVSEVVWLKPNPPAELVEFWKEYPEIDTVDAKLAVIDKIGYQRVGHFIFPPSAWTDDYYDPMEVCIAQKAPQWQGNPEDEAILETAQNEIDLFRRYSDFFSYAFFVMQKL